MSEQDTTQQDEREYDFTPVDYGEPEQFITLSEDEFTLLKKIQKWDLDFIWEFAKDIVHFRFESLNFKRLSIELAKTVPLSIEVGMRIAFFPWRIDKFVRAYENNFSNAHVNITNLLTDLDTINIDTSFLDQDIHSVVARVETWVRIDHSAEINNSDNSLIFRKLTKYAANGILEYENLRNMGFGEDALKIHMMLMKITKEVVDVRQNNNDNLINYALENLDKIEKTVRGGKLTTYAATLATSILTTIPAVSYITGQSYFTMTGVAVLGLLSYIAIGEVKGMRNRYISPERKKAPVWVDEMIKRPGDEIPVQMGYSFDEAGRVLDQARGNTQDAPTLREVAYNTEIDEIRIFVKEYFPGAESVLEEHSVIVVENLLLLKAAIGANRLRYVEGQALDYTEINNYYRLVLGELTTVLGDRYAARAFVRNYLGVGNFVRRTADATGTFGRRVRNENLVQNRPDTNTHQTATAENASGQAGGSLLNSIARNQKRNGSAEPRPESNTQRQRVVVPLEDLSGGRAEATGNGAGRLATAINALDQLPEIVVRPEAVSVVSNRLEEIAVEANIGFGASSSEYLKLKQTVGEITPELMQVNELERLAVLKFLESEGIVPNAINRYNNAKTKDIKDHFDINIDTAVLRIIELKYEYMRAGNIEVIRQYFRQTRAAIIAAINATRRTENKIQKNSEVSGLMQAWTGEIYTMLYKPEDIINAAEERRNGGEGFGVAMSEYRDLRSLEMELNEARDLMRRVQSSVGDFSTTALEQGQVVSDLQKKYDDIRNNLAPRERELLFGFLGTKSSDLYNGSIADQDFHGYVNQLQGDIVRLKLGLLNDNLTTGMMIKLRDTINNLLIKAKELKVELNFNGKPDELLKSWLGTNLYDDVMKNAK